MKKVFSFAADTNKKNKEAFNDALPIGNGHIGAMIYGGVSEEKLVLNENTLWLGKKNRIRFSKDFYENYQKVQKLVLEEKYEEAEKLASESLFPNPKGEAIYSVAGLLHIKLSTSQEIKNYARTLHLDEGYVTVSYDTNENSISRTYFASYPEDILGIEFQSEKEIEMLISLDRDKLVDRIFAEDSYIHLSASFNQKDKLYILLKVEAEQAEAIGASLRVRGKRIHIYVSMATTLYQKNPKVYVEKCLKNISFTSAFTQAKKDYRSLYQRQSFHCNDQDMTYLYNLSRYFMISSSRNNLPATLQGLWNQDFFPAWDSKYTININLQMNYWNVFAANLEECFLPVLKLLERMHPNGKKLAKELYHCPGFVAHHNTDIYGDCGLQDHYLPATIWPLGAAWLSLSIFEYYAYKQDIAILKKYGYLLEEASLFLLNLLIKDQDGYYVLCPSLSPENSFLVNQQRHHLTSGCVMDDEILTDLFSKTIKMNQLLNKNTQLSLKLEEALQHLHPFKRSRYNTLQEWHKDYEEAEPGHRHISHLYGLYPASFIEEEKEELWVLAKNTLKRRLDNGGGHTGWSKAWITAMYARLKEKELAYQSFKEFVQNSTSSVGLDLHPPFQIDGNFGIAAAIKEMFVYEKEEYIELFPAIPSEITDLEFSGIWLKGNLKLSLKLENQVLNYQIETPQSKTIRLKINQKIEEVSLKKGKNSFCKLV